jgi:hypothetical protein
MHWNLEEVNLERWADGWDGIGPGANHNLLALSCPFWTCWVGSKCGMEVIWISLGAVKLKHLQPASQKKFPKR